MNTTRANLDWETLVNALPVIITHLDPDFRVVCQFNAHNTPLECSAGELFLPENMQHFRQAQENQAAIRFEDPVTADGHVWYEHYVAVLTDERGMVISSTDISARKQAENASLQEAHFLKRLLDTIDAGVLIFNFDTKQTSYANRFMEHLHGKALAEIPEHHYLGQIHPDDFDDVWYYGETVLTNLDDGEVATREYRVIDRNGEVRWLMVRDTPLTRDETGHIVENLGIAVDITDRVALEEDLKRVNRWFTAIMNNSTDAISISRYLVPLSYDNVEEIAMNKRLEELTGYTHDELKGMRPSEILAGEMVPTIEDRLKERLMDTDRPGIAEGLLKRKDGTIIPFESLAVKVLDETDNVIEVLTFVRDISERKIRERDLLGAKIQAETALKARDMFIANMSHELRSPLNSIGGYVQLLRDQEGLPPDAIEHLRNIDYSVDHLSHLIGDILDVSRVEAGYDSLYPTAFNPRYVLSRLQGMLVTQAKRKRLTLQVEAAHDLPNQIRMDEVKLKQILINAIDNAIKYTDAGTVTVRMETTAESVLRCFVVDTGPGISAENLSRLWQPFERGDNASAKAIGSGLGLAISKRLVDLMGGQIDISGSESQGTTVTIELPFERVQERPDDHETHQNALHIHAGGGYTILTVDDQPLDRRLLAALLERRGFHVQVADSASAALSIIEAKMPDLIFTDLRMPHINGIDLVRSIRERERHTPGLHVPIIALTADTIPQNRQCLLDAGCDEVVFKPYQIGLLLEVVAQQLHLEIPASDPMAQSRSAPAKALTTDMLAVLPQDWLHEMYRLSVAGQHEEALSHIRTLEDAHPELAEQLSTTVRLFWTSSIADLIAPLLT